MEDPPRKQDKKNNKKTFPVTLNVGAGAGSFGIGGVLLLGGALVTATIFSAFAFKKRKQHRSSSENSDKNMSQETKTGDGSHHMNLMMKSNKDFLVDPDIHNPSDGLTSMKEMQTEDIQDLVVNEKHDYEKEDDGQLDSGDGNEGVICSVVGEDQKGTSSYVDSVFENGELDCEEEVIMEARNEDDSSKVLQRDVGGEEQRYLTPIDNGKGEQIEAKSLVSDEAITPIETYEAIEGVEVEECLAKDIAQAPEEGKEEAKDRETVFMNEEAACVKQVIVDDNPQVQFTEEQEKENGYGDDEIIVENFDGGLINETGNAYEIVSELGFSKEEEEGKEKEAAAAVIAGCVRHVKGQNDHQLEFVEDEKEQDHTTVREDNPTAKKVKEQTNIEDGSVKFDEREQGCEMPHVQLIEAAKVDDQTKGEDNPPTNLTNKEEKVEVTIEKVTVDDSTKKDEIPHVESVEEDENEEDVTVKTELVSDESKDSSVKCKQEEPTPGARPVEGCENEENVTVRTEVVPDELEDSYVKSMREEPTPYIQSVECKNAEEDVTTKTEVVPDEIEKSFVKSMQEEQAPEAKTSNQNIEENTEKSRTILGKVQNDSDLNNSVKEDEDSKSASMSVIELAKGRKEALASEPWNLKLLTWSLLVSIWCLCHWYTRLPFPELSLVCSLLFILILLGYRNHTTYLVKYA
uniref:cilia- and flagella-associated protein 251-like n=1 Tax=Erigeron canadensis TaxID=72917 RepID=UPI001CB88EE6|nr:cilia- and flagella-associated protein 251-like [Erigeron canadensis]